MTKRILSILIVVALIGGAMFTAPATTRAGAGYATVSSSTAGATNVVATINLTTMSAATNYVILFPTTFTLPSSIVASTILVNGTPVLTANLTGLSQITVTTAATVASTIVFSYAFGLTNLSNTSGSNFYIQTPTDFAVATIGSGGGGGSGGLTITPSSTAAGAIYVGLSVTFTPTSSVSTMYLNLSGYTLLTTPQAAYVSISGSTISSVSGSASSLVVAFGTPLTAYTSYTLYFSPNFGLMNPPTANTYTVTATLYGTGTILTGTVTIGGGGGSGGLTITPSSTAAGAIYVGLSVTFTPTSSVSTMYLNLSGYTLLTTPQAAYVSISGSTISSVSGSASSLVVAFGTPLTAYTSYTLYFSPNFGLMNPPTANTYTVTATLYGTGTTLTGTVAIGGGSGGSVTNLSLTVYPLTPGTAAQYYVSFTTSTTGTLLSGDHIYITFPSGTEFPTTYNLGQILVNNVACTSALSVSGTTLSVPVPSSLTSAQTYISVQIFSGFGIKNPTTNGYYNLQVSTSKDTTAVTSNSYQIYGTTISGLTVQAEPKSRGSNPRIQLSFVTSSSGYLTAGSDSIVVQFSSNVTMPPAFDPSYVTVNGTQASAVALLSTGKLSITTPVSISNNQQVTVVFAPEFGITNPSTAPATVTIQVSTSKDVSAMSTSYTTTTSQITQPQVTLTTNGVGKASGYTVTFQTGAGGALSAGSGRIYITLPVGTTVPVSIDAQNVKVNGTTASIVTSSTGNRRVDVTTPVAILANSQVQVVIDAAANVTNPSTARTDYTLSVYTTAEQTPITSSVYSIVNLPVTTAVTLPSSPDGLNGYYKTRPTVSLTATSPSGLAVSIYYRINAGSDTQYSSPIQLPDGSVTFSYYARDTQGNQEQARQLTFKVDTTAPLITITAPLEGSATGNADITVTGRTEAGASVVINSSPATAQATGDFTGSVTLHEGSNAIQVVATDLAGNKGQATLNVTLDTKPPVLTMTSPKIYSTVMTQQVAVSGKTDPGATVTVGGSKVNVAADGSFSIMYMFPKEGLNVVDITSTDAAGNVAKTGIPVTYVARTLIRLQVGNKTAMINDTTKTLQAAPVNIKGVVMVPLRFIGEAFGATVEWEPVFKIVRLQLGSTAIYLQIGYNYASVNGKRIVLQGLPSIIKGTTMVPIRFISEAFNAQVTWIAATQGVEITYPKP